MSKQVIAANGNFDFICEDPLGVQRYPMQTMTAVGTFGGGTLTLAISPLNEDSTQSDVFATVTGSLTGTGSINVIGHFHKLRVIMTGATGPNVDVRVQ